jgi:precorrin-2/cobalt-factor-2 C20-methyltransferase
MNKGTLYAVGIGPGDPELLTLKAARIIMESDVIAVPKGKEDGESLALSIISKAVPFESDKVFEAHFPMTKGSQREALKPVAEKIIGFLSSGKDVAFPTLGDPVLYSTFFHLYDAMYDMDPDIHVEIIPGVTSVTAASASAGRCLALSGEKVAIVPATYIEEFDAALSGFDTVVLMKVHRSIDKLKNALQRNGLMDKALYVSRASMEQETIKPLNNVEESDLDYFSIVIVRR